MKKYALAFTPEAITEIKDIIEWYNKQQKGLGNRFKTALKKELNKLKPNPFTRVIRYDEVRFAITDVFPYAAHYTINESSLTIVIHAVIAFAQNPDDNWKYAI